MLCGWGGKGEVSLENQLRGIQLGIAFVLSPSITPPERPPPPSSLRNTGGSWFHWECEAGAAGRAGLRSGGPGCESPPALMVLSLTPAPSLLVFGHRELLPSPRALTGGILPRALCVAISPFTFPFLQRNGKVIAEKASGAGCGGLMGRKAEGPFWEKKDLKASYLQEEEEEEGRMQAGHHP